MIFHDNINDIEYMHYWEEKYTNAERKEGSIGFLNFPNEGNTFVVGENVKPNTSWLGAVFGNSLIVNP